MPDDPIHRSTKAEAITSATLAWLQVYHVTTPRSTKAEAITSATPVLRGDLKLSLARSTKAEAITSATHAHGRAHHRRARRSTKAEAITSATPFRTLRMLGSLFDRSTKAEAITSATPQLSPRRQPAPATLNEGRGDNLGDTTPIKIPAVHLITRSTKAEAITSATRPPPRAVAERDGRSTKAEAITSATPVDEEHGGI